jgi:hypothetical protein
MKTLILILLLTLTTAQAAGDLGVGVMVGETTGFTAKKITGENAIDAGMGWSLGNNSHFQIHSDWLWNKTDALYFQDARPLDLYFGIGGRMEFDDEIEVGIRLPVGLSAYTSERNLEGFAEVAPIFDLLPEGELNAHLMLGVRVYL